MDDRAQRMTMTEDIFRQYVMMQDYLHDRMNHLSKPTISLWISIDNDVRGSVYGR